MFRPATIAPRFPFNSLERLESRDNPSETYLDTSFGTNGITALEGFSSVADVQVMPDGRIFVIGDANTGTTTDFGVVRLTAEGQLDPTFGTNGRAVVAFDLAPNAGDSPVDFVVLPNGGLVIAGTAANGNGVAKFVAVAQLSANGKLDPTFDGDGKVTFGWNSDPNPVDLVDAIGRQADGSLVITGEYQHLQTQYAARLTATGAFDTNFGTAGVLDLGSEARFAAVDGNGQIFVLGSDLSPNEMTTVNYYVSRLEASGQPDPAYGVAGKSEIIPYRFNISASRGTSFTLTPLRDGSVAVSFNTLLGSFRQFVTDTFRLESDGTRDSGFGTDGISESVWGPTIDVGATGRIAGLTARSNSEFGGGIPSVAGLTPVGQLDPTFGTDGVINVSGQFSNRFQVAQPGPTELIVAGLTASTNGSGFYAVRRYITTPNEPPTVAAPASITVSPGTSATFQIAVADSKTAGSELVVTATTDNGVLFPSGFFLASGTGNTRTLTISPVAGMTGDANIVVTVSDGENAKAVANIPVTVGKFGNQRPTLTVSGSDTELVSGTPAIFSIAVGDAETPADALQVTAVTDNGAVFPDGSVVLDGTGTTRTLTLSPALARTGPATVRVAVRDADGSSATLEIAVNVGPSGTTPPANESPTFTGFPSSQSLTAGMPTTLTFTVGDAKTPLDDLIVTVVSDNVVVFPVGSIVIGGSGGLRTVTLTPATNGLAKLQVTVRDADGGFATATLAVFAGPDASAPHVNEPPAIAASPASLTIVPRAPATVLIALSDADSAADAFQVTVVADDGTVFPAGTVVLTGSGAARTLTLTPRTSGTAMVLVTVTDGNGGSASVNLSVNVTAVPDAATLLGSREFAAGPDAGGGAVVATYNPDGSPRRTLAVFQAGLTGGVRVASADFNRDGVADVVVGTGPGSATRVEIYDGKTSQMLFAVDPFEPAFTGGVFVAAGDTNGDGVPDLVITPDEGGGPRVRVLDGVDFTSLADFFGIDDPDFRGGARAAVSDIDGDGVGDLLVAAGFGGGPRVAGYDGRSLGQSPRKVFGDFFAFEETLRNGIFVAAGDLNGDGFADLVCGGGPGGGPRVLALDGKSLRNNQYVNLANFFAGDTNGRGGVRVAVKDLDGDPRGDLVAGSGSGAGSQVAAYLGANLQPAGTPAVGFEFAAFQGFAGGVYVG